MENIKYHELKQVMHQYVEQFINILNQFWTITHSQFDIDTINSQCFHTPHKGPKLPYLFYANEARLKHNESTFLRNDGDVYIFRVEYRHCDTCPKSFQLQNNPNFIGRLQSKVQEKTCWSNFVLVIIQHVMVW
jgi:hypothetical protein